MNPKDTPDLEEQKLELYTEAEQLMNIAQMATGSVGVSPAFMIALQKVVHQHQNALLRELENALPADKPEDRIYPVGGGQVREEYSPYSLGRNDYRSEVKQILADARVGEEPLN